MKRELEPDLARLKKLAFRSFERSGPLLERFHCNQSRIDSHHAASLIWRVYDWLNVPLSLWPIDFEGLAKHILTEIERSAGVDVDIIRLLELVGAPPNRETSKTVAAFEHVIEAGNYDHLVKQPEKFTENEVAIETDEELQNTWKEIKQRWGTLIKRNARGVVRRRLSQERNLRGDWFFDWQDARKKFELFFDAMCYRWKLYGMEHDKPLLLKISVNPTPHGTMIVIPRHWSLDPSRDLKWGKINEIHRAHGAGRQGPKLSKTRIETLKDAKKVERLWIEARAKGHRGDARYDYVHKSLGKRLDTDHCWVNRLLRNARKKGQRQNKSKLDVNNASADCDLPSPLRSFR